MRLSQLLRILRYHAHDQSRPIDDRLPAPRQR
jgi:hypothetical protein